MISRAATHHQIGLLAAGVAMFAAGLAVGRAGVMPAAQEATPPNVDSTAASPARLSDVAPPHATSESGAAAASGKLEPRLSLPLGLTDVVMGSSPEAVRRRFPNHLPSRRSEFARDEIPPIEIPLLTVDGFLWEWAELRFSNPALREITLHGISTEGNSPALRRFLNEVTTRHGAGTRVVEEAETRTYWRVGGWQIMHYLYVGPESGDIIEYAQISEIDPGRDADVLGPTRHDLNPSSADLSATQPTAPTHRPQDFGNLDSHREDAQ